MYTSITRIIKTGLRFNNQVITPNLSKFQQVCKHERNLFC
jgi:hypothetical protein